MKTKITKESRNLLIALLLGDGTICSNNVFKLAHAEQQKDYLEWKIKQLNYAGIRNNGLKDSEETEVKIFADGKEVKQIEIPPIEIGYGRKVSIINIWVNQIEVKNIDFVIASEFEELEKSNNQVTFEIKK